MKTPGLDIERAREAMADIMWATKGVSRNRRRLLGIKKRA